MCRWMGSHFHNWIDCNGVTFLVELLEWGRNLFGISGITKFLVSRDSKIEIFAVKNDFLLLF